MDGSPASSNPRWFSETVTPDDQARPSEGGPVSLAHFTRPQSTGDRNIPTEHLSQHHDPIPAFAFLAHEPHQKERSRLIAALEYAAGGVIDHGPDEAADRCWKIARKLSECCSSSIIACEQGTGIVKLFPRRCKSRLCPYCQRGRTFKLQKKVLGLVQKIDRLKKLELTVMSSDEPLSVQIKAMTKNFAKLRQHPEWKRRVTGGVYTIEVTYNRSTKRWHPHLHVLLDAPFWRQDKISDLWFSITGNSSIVWIEHITSQKAAVFYVTKYVSKSECVTLLPDGMIAEWAMQMQGQRTVSTFGNLHSIKLEEDEADDRPDCDPIAELTSLEYAARNGDRHAARLTRNLYFYHRRRTPDAHGGAAAEYQRRGRRIAAAIRAWQCRQQEGDDPQIIHDAPPRTRGRDPDHRPLGLWENEPRFGML